MPLRIFDFKCENNHITEKLIQPDIKEIECPVCGLTALKVISPIAFHLDGCDPGFPGAYDRWAKDHKQRAVNEAKKRDS